MPSILDPRFKYTPSHATDIRVTFERERQRLAAKRQPPICSQLWNDKLVAQLREPLLSVGLGGSLFL